jgi:hypothetical protein
MTDTEGIIKDTVSYVETFSKESDWIKEFRQLDKEAKHKLVKSIYSNYTLALIEGINKLEPEIHLTAIGTLKIKKSRKQYLDLLKDGVSKEDAVIKVKQDYRTLNGKS